MAEAAADEAAGKTPRQFAAGFRTKAVEIKLVEKHAVKLARADYEADGWEVRERGKPFDLELLRGEERLTVEVKGTTSDGSGVVNEYHHPEQDSLWELTRAVIRTQPVARVAAEAQVSTRTVKRARAGQLTGKTARALQARAILTAWAIEHARAKLKPDGVTVYGITPETLLATYLDKQF